MDLHLFESGHQNDVNRLENKNGFQLRAISQLIALGLNKFYLDHSSQGTVSLVNFVFAIQQFAPFHAKIDADFHSSILVIHN